MSTTTNRPTPATASTLHAQLDTMLTPTRATTPEVPGTATSALSLVDELNAIARRSQPRPRRVPAPQPEPVALHEAYAWDPMPTSNDPLGLRERMEYVEAAIASHTVPAPRTPAAPPVSPLVEARLTKAHQRLAEILG